MRFLGIDGDRLAIETGRVDVHSGPGLDQVRHNQPDNERQG